MLEYELHDLMYDLEISPLLQLKRKLQWDIELGYHGTRRPFRLATLHSAGSIRQPIMDLPQTQGPHNVTTSNTCVDSLISISRQLYRKRSILLQNKSHLISLLQHTAKMMSSRTIIAIGAALSICIQPSLGQVTPTNPGNCGTDHGKYRTTPAGTS